MSSLVRIPPCHGGGPGSNPGDRILSTIRIKKDWRGNIIFYLPVSSEYYKEEGLHCVIRREEIEIDKDGVKQTISKHDKDLVELKGHEVLELSDVGDYATGIFLPRKVSEEENENI